MNNIIVHFWRREKPLSDFFCRKDGRFTKDKGGLYKKPARMKKRKNRKKKGRRRVPCWAAVPVRQDTIQSMGKKSGKRKELVKLVPAWEGKRRFDANLPFFYDRTGAFFPSVH